MQLMEEHTRKMTKTGKDNFVQNGYSSAPQNRGQQLINIRNRNHYHIRINNGNWRNKYRCEVWHNTGCGCRTAQRRFQY